MLSTRTSIFCLVISLSLVASKCNDKVFELAPNCEQYECPAYTVVHTEQEFEIRLYKDARWADISISANSYEEGASKGFKTLSDYYNGQNRDHVTFNKTSPVLVQIRKSSYSVYFYLPEKYQQFAPVPLKIKEIGFPYIPVYKHKYVAVKRFYGVINDAVITTQFDALKKSLNSSRDYQRAAAGDVFMVAAYSSPLDLQNRVNEVFIWFN